jgi:hypothetical protein
MSCKIYEPNFDEETAFMLCTQFVKINPIGELTVAQTVENFAILF